MFKWFKNLFKKSEDVDFISGLPKGMIEEKLKSRQQDQFMFADISPTLFTEDVVVIEGGPVFVDFDGNLRRVKTIPFVSESSLKEELIHFMRDVNRVIRETGLYYVYSVHYDSVSGKWNIRGCEKNECEKKEDNCCCKGECK